MNGYPHIELNAKGQPGIDGTRTRVFDIVLDQIAYHWDAEEIQRQHPDLTLAQIHSTLAYYYDHQAEVDAMIEDQLRKQEDFFAQYPEPPLMLKLRKIKAEGRQLP